MQERITCQIKLNPGPVKRIKIELVKRMRNARINRVLLFRIGSGSMGL